MFNLFLLTGVFMGCLTVMISKNAVKTKLFLQLRHSYKAILYVKTTDGPFCLSLPEASAY